MHIIIKVAKSKKDTKYLAVYKVNDDGTQKFITCDFYVVKRLLGLSRWCKIDDKYLAQYEYDDVVLEV